MEDDVTNRPTRNSEPQTRNSLRVSRRGFLVLAAGALAAACTPAPTPPPKAPAADKAAPPAPAAPKAEPAAPAAKAPAVQPGAKTIVVGQGREINGLSRIGRTDTEASHVVNAGLVTRDTENYKIIPWMAEELPSVQKGTWKVNPDGTMVTTWKVKPDIKWHDGKPFSTKDFILGWQVLQDARVKTDNRRPGDLIEKMETPDDRTLVIYWKKQYPWADALFSNHLFAMPRHLMEDVYRSGDFDAFNTHPYWNKGAVHLGAFKVVDFVPGSHVEFAANEQYFLGRPKIDKLIWRIIPDSNAVLTAVLANQVDVTTRSALTIEGGIVAERDWATKGQGTVKFTPINWVWLNPSGTNPFFGWDAPNQNKVRQAMLQAINRQEITETLFAGKEQPLDFPLAPGRPQFKAAEAVARKYPYDLQRAQQLLTEAGWRKGADGILVNGKGERFSVEFRTTAGRKDEEQVQAAVANYLKVVGIETQIANLPDRQINAEPYLNRWSGLHLGSHNIQVEDWSDRYHSSRIPNEANKYVYENVSQWANPAKDKLLEEQDNSLDPNRRDQLIVEILKLFSEDLPHLPIKFSAEVTTWRKGIVNVPIRIESGGENYRSWNVHLWDKTE
jgi:peptide/nickel transport system substrate-binding protein